MVGGRTVHSVLIPDVVCRVYRTASGFSRQQDALLAGVAGRGRFYYHGMSWDVEPVENNNAINKYQIK